MLQKLIRNKYFLAFVAIMLVIATFKINQVINDKKLEAQRIEIKKLKIKNDTLTKVAEGHYRKLVADTLTKKELRKKIEELEIKVKDGVLVADTKLRPKEIIKQIDTVYVGKDSISLIDYYPQKENFFARYEAKINLLDSTNVGKFSFGDLPISLVISQNEDGTFQSDLKAPDFITLESLDILAQPLEPQKVDNFGFLAGGKVNRNFTNGELGYEIIGGFRFKKVNILTSVNTNEEFGIGTLIEF